MPSPKRERDRALAEEFLVAMRAEFERPGRFVRTWVSGEVVDHGRRSAAAVIRFTAEDGKTLYAHGQSAAAIRGTASPATIEEIAEISYSGEIDEPLPVHHVDADGTHWLGAE